MGTPNQYYRPYLASDSDLSDADSQASWSRPSTPEPPSNATEPLSTDKLVGPDYALLAKGLNVPVLQTSGPTFPKDKVEDTYVKNKYYIFDPNAKDAPGTKIKKGSSITLVLGDGIGYKPIPVPFLIGLNYQAAKLLLDSAGINFGAIVLDPTVQDTASAFIYKQSPTTSDEDGLPVSIRPGQLIDIWLQGTRPKIDSLHK